MIIAQALKLSTDLVKVVYIVSQVPWNHPVYLKKGTVLEAEIFSVFISHLGLHTDKVSLKSVTSIEHMLRLLGRPYRAMSHRETF